MATQNQNTKKNFKVDFGEGQPKGFFMKEDRFLEAYEKKYDSIVLNNVNLKNETPVSDWLNSVKNNTIPKTTINIHQLDENGNPSYTWTLNNAWPAKITNADLKSDPNEVAVESLALSQEGLGPVNG